MVLRYSRIDAVEHMPTSLNNTALILKLRKAHVGQLFVELSCWKLKRVTKDLTESDKERNAVTESEGEKRARADEVQCVNCFRCNVQ